MDILEQITTLLTYRELSKAELARRLDISPQNLNRKLRTKNMDLQFLNKVANVLDCNLQMFFQDNKYKRKLITRKEVIYEQIINLNDEQLKLIEDLLKQLK